VVLRLLVADLLDRSERFMTQHQTGARARAPVVDVTRLGLTAWDPPQPSGTAPACPERSPSGKSSREWHVAASRLATIVPLLLLTGVPGFLMAVPGSRSDGSDTPRWRVTRVSDSGLP
jgi:hypothetical protein